MSDPTPPKGKKQPTIVRRRSSPKRGAKTPPRGDKGPRGGGGALIAKTRVKGGAARLAALDLLEEVLIRKTPLDERLAWSLERGPMKALEPRDRAFTRAIAATTLRRLGQIDALLAQRIERGIPSAAHRVRNLLRCAVAEIIFLETPLHAVVSTAVALTREFEKGENYKGLVNAVLRRVGEAGPDDAAKLDAPRVNTPGWLMESWTAAYGEETARAIAEAHMQEPPLDITTKADPEKWADDLQAELLPMGTLRRKVGGRIEDLPGFKSGSIWVQDAAAALPARLLGNVEGQVVADLCAAPGGKTMQLAAMGAKVVAVDQSAKRLVRLSKNLKRTELAAQIVNADAAKWRPEAPLSFVLLDAPCSATGTIRRHPDVARLKKPEEIESLLPTQSALLDGAAQMLAPGGTLIYCVCSLQPEEGEDQIEAFLTRHSEFTLNPVTTEDVGGSAEIITPRGEVRTLPCHLAEKGGMDGFYIARLLKT